jgi:hypothetical protein
MVDLIAGKQTLENDGIYLRQPGAPEVYVLRSGLATALARPADDWRNHTIAEIPGDSVEAIEVVRGGKSYRVHRQGSGWALTPPAGQPDSSKISALLSSYRDVKASGFAGKLQLDSLQQAKPRRSARVLDRQNKPLLSMVFDSVGGAFWVRVNGTASRGGAEEWYRLESWTADQLTPPDSSLRKH